MNGMSLLIEKSPGIFSGSYEFELTKLDFSQFNALIPESLAKNVSGIVSGKSKGNFGTNLNSEKFSYDLSLSLNSQNGKMSGTAAIKLFNSGMNMCPKICLRGFSASS